MKTVVTILLALTFVFDIAFIAINSGNDLLPEEWVAFVVINLLIVGLAWFNMRKKKK